MTPSEVQRIELALRGLTVEVSQMREEIKGQGDDVDDLKAWRSKAQGALAVFALAAPTVSALLVAYLTK